MVAKLEPLLEMENFAELHERLGEVPLHRIRLNPPPGTATETDLLRLLDGEPKRLCELVEGTLVEKPMGTWESIVAASVIQRLMNFIEPLRLGLVVGADGPFRMLRGNVRYPEVSFVPWASLPDPLPDEAIWSVVPALAIEILSRTNTRREMERKVEELFELGADVIWIIDPSTQDAQIHRPDLEAQYVAPDGILDAEPILPNFRLPLTELFAPRRPS